MKVTIDGHVIEGTPEEIKGYFELFGANFPVDAKPKETEEFTPKFKEGDRVKALDDGEDGDIKAGEIGTIEWISESARDDGDPYYIFVETDDNSDYFRPQDLEFVTEEEVEEVGDSETWKKGDKVRNKKSGEIVEVYAYQPKKRTYGEDVGYTFFGHKVGFTFINRHDYEQWDSIDDYELVDETPSKPTTIKRKARVGERILITDASEAQTGKSYKNGDILTVTEIGSCDLPLCGDYLTIFDYEYEVIVEENTRKPDEFKKGDIVRILKNECGDAVGTLVEVIAILDGGVDYASNKSGRGVYGASNEAVELIAPVESRIDL